MDISFLNISNNWLLHTDTHLFTKSVSCRSATVLQSRESPRRMRRSGVILWMNGEFIRSHTWVHAFPLAVSKGKTITLIQTCLYYPCYRIRSPNEILLISRPLVFMRNKSCRVRCLTYVRSMSGSPGDVSEEPVT